MNRTVKISEEAYQRLSHHCKYDGKSMLEVLSNLILRSFPALEEIKSPVIAQTEQKSPPAKERSAYYRWLHGEEVEHE